MRFWRYVFFNQTISHWMVWGKNLAAGVNVFWGRDLQEHHHHTNHHVIFVLLYSGKIHSSWLRVWKHLRLSKKVESPSFFITCPLKTSCHNSEEFWLNFFASNWGWNIALLPAKFEQIWRSVGCWIHRPKISAGYKIIHSMNLKFPSKNICVTKKSQ